MTDSNAEQRTQVSDATGELRAGRRESRGGSFLRRFVFVLLLLLVVLGIVVAGIVLRGRLNEAVARANALATEIEALQGEVDDLAGELAEAQQDLGDLELDYQEARAADRTEILYNLFLLRAQSQAAKALSSLAEEDIGQARRELEAVQVSLEGASELAPDIQKSVEDMVSLQERVSQAQDDLNDNAFAAQQTVEIVWRDLDEMLEERLVSP